MNQNNLKKEIHRYIRSIKNSIPLTYKKRTELMNHFSRGVWEYCSEHKEVTMDEIYDEFGTIEQVTDSLISEIPSKYIVNHIKLKKFLIFISICIIIGLIGRFIYYRYRIQCYMSYKIEIELEEEKSTNE